MEIAYSDQSLNDIAYWKKSGNKAIQKKITQLVQAILANPFEGIGKPEPLKHELTGKWSRRINTEHRMVYELTNDQKTIKIHSLRGHYLA